MATFVIYVDAPSWEMHFDPTNRSYYFMGHCAVRLYMFMDRPFAYPVSSMWFSPTAPFPDDLAFEHARPHPQQSTHPRPSVSAVRDFPDYIPRSPPRSTGSWSDPSEDTPSRNSSGRSTSVVPMERDDGSDGEATVTQPVRGATRPRRGAHVLPARRLASRN